MVKIPVGQKHLLCKHKLSPTIFVLWLLDDPEENYKPKLFVSQ